MDRRPRRSTENDSQTGFTVIVCDGCEGGELPLLAVLRDTIRRSPNAVLVRARCPLGRLWCHARKISAPAESGHLVLVQRCTSTRRPLGPVIPVGPVETDEDLAALTRWLETTSLSTEDLPSRLRRIPSLRHRAAQN